MEVLKLFLLFLTVKSTSCEWFERSAIKTSDFGELVTNASGFVEFSDTLKATHKSSEFGQLYSRTITDLTFSDVGYILNHMVHLFMLQSNKYVGLRLIEYCELTQRLIENKKFKVYLRENRPRDETIKDFYLDNDAKDVLRFPDDCVYCMATPVHDSGLMFGVLFQTIFLFRTIDRDVQYPCEGLKTTTEVHRGRIYNHLAYHDLHQTLHPKLPKNTDLDGIVQRLREVRREITDFTKMFCSRWKPFVSDGFLTKTVSEEVQKESRFVRHVFLNERCKIIDGDILEENKTTDWWADYPKYVCDWIINWDCKNVLESQEYGFEEYEKSVNQKLVVVRPPESEEIVVRGEFSLAALHEQLKSNKCDVNVFRYYKIVSEIELYSSIKEGTKVLKGIELVVRSTDPGKIDRDAVDARIRELRTTLSAFKSVFDELVFRMQREKRTTDVDHNPQKVAFDRRVSALIRLLDDVGTWETGKREILKTLGHTNVDIAAETPIGSHSFREYYFVGPILHVGQLYRFDPYGF